MNNHQVPQPRSSCNGYGRRKSQRDVATRFDNKFRDGKTNSCRISFGNGGVFELPSCDRLIYLSACLIGHQVEVQVLDGSIFSGIFHATNTEDFGIVLKMACLIKDGSQAQKNIADSPSKHPSRILIIPGKDLVQLIAKGVPVTSDVPKNEFQHDKKQELMIDSCISQSRHVELGRELEPWIPDENDPECPELDNIFDGSWNRGWNQFEANETLFGVKSTFNEELYTTKLARGPQLKELEREAARIAREIEGEETFDLHLAEERGIQLDENFDIDEETRFSSVHRAVGDGGYDEIEDILLDSQNDETFGVVSGSVIGKPQTNMSFLETNERAQFSSRSTLLGEVQSSEVAKSTTGTHHSSSADNAQHLLAEQLPKYSSEIDSFRLRDNRFIGSSDSYLCKDDKEHKPSDQSRSSKAEDLHSLPRLKKENYDKVGLSPNALAFDPSWSLSKGQESTSSSNELTDGVVPIKAQGTTVIVPRPGSSSTSEGQEKTGSSNEPLEGSLPPKIRGITTSVAQPSSSSSTADHVGATSSSTGRGLSPSSSVGSFSSEKFALNPHAKEFKFNPNAKNFIPTPIALRISSPVADSSFYYPTNMTAVSHMHGMPIGIRLGPSFASQQPVLFNPQTAVPQHQPYYHPNGPQYGKQMVIGQPRPVMFMPAYPQEMPYQGREF